MRIWHISDTHGYHNLLSIPKYVDTVIHSGDASNYRDVIRNEIEMYNFIQWYSGIDIPNKIYVAGNHDSSIEAGRFNKQYFADKGIIYLQDDEVTIVGVKFYGSPYTPFFNDWCFMIQRHKIAKKWNEIPQDTNVLITHGAPKGILDLTENREHELEQCGDKSLLNRIGTLDKLKMVLFGHIHDCGDTVSNGGILIRDGITYSNGSVVKDGHFGKLYHNGNTFNIF